MELPKKIVAILNEQVKNEADSAYIYLQMSVWADIKGYVGLAHYMRIQYNEEITHMLKIMDYLLHKNVMPQFDTVAKPKQEYTSFEDALAASLAHEKKITKDWEEIFKLCMEEADSTTLVFSQWFITEQAEEEDKVQTLIDRINVFNNSNDIIFLIDKELGQR